MVSLWPWKGKDNSPASFEKALSSLSGKITRANSRLDTHRQHARRFKALWTLYTTFAYLLYSIILASGLGWRNWGFTEYSAVAGGPVLIYAVRIAARSYFDYRIAKTQRYLEGLQKERDETIERLKAATKYNSTQKLLEKYGGEASKQNHSKAKQEPGLQRKSQSGQGPQKPVMRTGLPPPPTANIYRLPSQPPAPQSGPSPPSQYQAQPPLRLPPQQSLESPGFAPNAFTTAPQYVEESHWYDRLLDVLLGEDEMQPKNRIVLICHACRRVNGQAPPGVKTLGAVGRWRCVSCDEWNGEESETEKVLADIRTQSADEVQVRKEKMDSRLHPDNTADDVVITADCEEEQEGAQPDTEDKPKTGITNVAEPGLGSEGTDIKFNGRMTRSRSKASKAKT